jgi:hypothetical protein
MKRVSLILLVLLYWALHQDFWNWKASAPLTFGFLPPGLTYHALYTLGIAALMWLLVSVAWPSALEADAEAAAESSPGPNAE